MDGVYGARRWLEVGLLFACASAVVVLYWSLQLSPAMNDEYVRNAQYMDSSARDRATFPQTFALACAFGAAALGFFGSAGCLLAVPGRGRGDLPRVACGFVTLVSALGLGFMTVAVLLAYAPTRGRLVVVTAAFIASTSVSFRLWRIAVRIHRRTLADLERLQREQVAREGGILPDGPREGVTASVDALVELADLRDRGALTQAEFEQQKKKLLGSDS